jgi:hypothetical protein
VDRRRLTMSVHKVVYRGLSDIRRMSVKDLKKAGVSVGADLEWNKPRSGSRPAVYVQDPSDRLLEIFRQEGTFTVTEVDESTLREVDAEPILVGEPLDDTGSVVKDGTTGQQSEAGERDANADPVVAGTTEATATGSAGAGSSTRGGSRSGRGSTGRSTSGNG